MIAFELRLALAALRNLVRAPTRRTLWLVAVIAAFVAAAVGIAPASFGSRDLGGLRITPLLAVGAVAGIFSVAALTGAATVRPYGTRAADAIWWRFAGISRDRAERGTAIILIGRVALSFGAGAIPLGIALALAAPDQGPAILTFTAAAICTATLASAIALACTYRDAESTRRNLRAAGAPAGRPRQNVPSGLGAARWIIARRRGEQIVPLGRFVWGFGGGIILAQVATRLNGQLVSLAAVIGPLAFLLAGAIHSDTAVEDLRSPWWRITLGSRPTAVCAWAISASFATMLLLAGAATGLGLGLGTLVAGVIAIPTCALIVPVHKLLGLAVDVMFPELLDRRGAATVARVGVIAIAIAVVVTLAWSVAPVGAGAMLVAADIVLVLTALVATRWVSMRLGA